MIRGGLVDGLWSLFGGLGMNTIRLREGRVEGRRSSTSAGDNVSVFADALKAAVARLLGGGVDGEMFVVPVTLTISLGDEEDRSITLVVPSWELVHFCSALVGVFRSHSLVHSGKLADEVGRFFDE